MKKIATIITLIIHTGTFTFCQLDVKIKSYIGNNQTGSMTITKNSLNEAIISVTTSASIPGDITKTYFYGPTFADGKIDIPNDGKNYWIVSFDPGTNNPVKRKGYGSINIHCHCPDGGGAGCIESCGGPALESEGTVICPPGFCDDPFDPGAGCGSCELPPIVAYVVIEADAIFYNGVLYRHGNH